MHSYAYFTLLFELDTVVVGVCRLDASFDSIVLLSHIFYSTYVV